MRKLVAGIVFAAFVTVGGAALAQDLADNISEKPTAGECYTPCAQQYTNATDRMRCIAACCGC